MPEVENALRLLGNTRAPKAIDQALKAAGRSVANDCGAEVAAKLPQLAGALRKKIYWFSRKGSGTGYVRFWGTGKRGTGFIRPRHLGLDRPQLGVFMNRKPRFGAPFITIPHRTTYPLGFVTMPQTGTKRSNTTGAPRGGRNMKPWDGSEATRKRAVLFQRRSHSRYPIDQVPGRRLSELVDIVPMIESAQLLLVLRFQIEMEKHLAEGLDSMRRWADVIPPQTSGAAGNAGPF